MLTLTILARILTPADFGTTALAMTLISTVDMILEIPVAQALIRLTDLDKSHLDTSFTLSVLRSLLVALVVLVAAWPFAWLYNDGRLIAVLLALAIAPISKGFYSPNMVRFSRELSFSQTFIAEFAGKLCAFTTALVTVFAGGGYWAIVANYVVASTAATIISHILAPYKPSLSLRRLSDFAGFVGWFSLSQVVSALNWQFDRILLGRFVDKATFGCYALASDLAVFPTQSLIGPAMYPVMAAFSKINTDRERLQVAFLKTARFTMLISAPVCIGISLTASQIIPVLLGARWNDAAPFLRVLAAAVLAVPYFQTLYSFSLAVNRPAVLFQLNAIDLGVRILLISFGMYLYSINGVLFARILISAIVFMVVLLYARHIVGVGVLVQLKNLWKITVALIAMVVSVLVLQRILAPLGLAAFVELICSAAVGASTYIVALFGLGVRVTLGQGRIELSDK